MDRTARPAFPPPPAASPMPSAPMDPLLQDRLARLSASRSGRGQGAESGSAKPTAKRAGKRHAAKGSRTAAVLMSLTTTAGLSAYFQHVDSAAASKTTNVLTGVAVASGTSAPAATATTTPTVTAATTSTGSTPASSIEPTPVTPATAATAATPVTAATPATESVGAPAASTLADGTYAGATATNKWGPVQVQIIVTGGQIAESAALQTPTDDRKSISINARAVPALTSEVLTAQSAEIDTVSGATYTSDSYKASLQSAIDLARSTAAQAIAS